MTYPLLTLRQTGDGVSEGQTAIRVWVLPQDYCRLSVAQYRAPDPNCLCPCILARPLTCLHPLGH